MDELGIEAFKIGEDEELLDGGMIPHVSIERWVGIAPLPGGKAEEGNIQEIGLGGVGDGGLGGGDFRRDEVGLDGIGVDAVVQLGKGAVEVPSEGEALVFIFLEALEFLDEVELELDRDPRGELESDVAVRISSPVAPRLRLDADGPGALDPLLRREDKAVEAGLFFNPIEFDGIKTGVVDLLPKTEELDRVAVAEPVANQVVTGGAPFPISGPEAASRPEASSEPVTNAAKTSSSAPAGPATSSRRSIITSGSIPRKS